MQRERGLMFRKYLAPDEGMFFILGDEGAHSFWMKNMQFSLDIIWIDENKAIVEIMQNVPPCSEVCPDFIPQRKAKFVLEVNAGFTQKNQIKVGDIVEF